MILLDFSNIIIGSIMIAHKTSNQDAASEDFIRHLVLNSIRNYRVKYRAKYGEIVICTDFLSSWRKEQFKYYKANRKKVREKQEQKGGMDWKELFSVINQIIKEIDEYFPYKVISVPHAEGDDVIAVLSKNFDENSIIISSDKDFSQLHRFKYLKQYSPIQKKMVITSDPYKYLKEHIIRGDKGDGIPNILSADDCILEGVRQKPISKKKIATWMNEPDMTHVDPNWKRNQRLIDFDYIPKDIADAILYEYKKTKITNGMPGRFTSYFVKNKLNYLMEHKGDFIL